MGLRFFFFFSYIVIWYSTGRAGRGLEIVYPKKSSCLRHFSFFFSFFKLTQLARVQQLWSRGRKPFVSIEYTFFFFSLCLSLYLELYFTRTFSRVCLIRSTRSYMCTELNYKNHTLVTRRHDLHAEYVKTRIYYNY